MFLISTEKNGFLSRWRKTLSLIRIFWIFILMACDLRLILKTVKNQKKSITLSEAVLSFKKNGKNQNGRRNCLVSFPFLLKKEPNSWNTVGKKVKRFPKSYWKMNAHSDRIKKSIRVLPISGKSC